MKIIKNITGILTLITLLGSWIYIMLVTSDIPYSIPINTIILCSIIIIIILVVYVCFCRSKIYNYLLLIPLLLWGINTFSSLYIYLVSGYDLNTVIINIIITLGILFSLISVRKRIKTK